MKSFGKIAVAALMLTGSTVGATTVATTSAEAGVSVGIGIGVPGPAPVYHAGVDPRCHSAHFVYFHHWLCPGYTAVSPGQPVYVGPAYYGYYDSGFYGPGYYEPVVGGFWFTDTFGHRRWHPGEFHGTGFHPGHWHH